MSPEPSAVETVPDGEGGTPRAGVWRVRLLVLAKLAVSSILLYWILSRANLAEIFAAAASVSVPLLLLAYSLDLLGLLISSTRWRGLLRAQGVDVPVGFLVKSFMVANFFNNLLPSTVGGDASRAYDSYQAASRTADAMASVIVDRLLGLLALVSFAVVSLPFARELTADLPALPAWIAVAGLGLSALVWVVFLGGARFLGRMAGPLPGPVKRLAKRVSSAFAAYRGQHRVLGVAFALSVLLQANVVFQFVLIAAAMGLPVPIVGFVLIVPLATFIMMIPVTINGIGLREGALALFLAAYGVGSSEAVAFAWLLYLGGLIQGVLGGIVYAMRRSPQT
jgi:glycosyltransferase 2 family protein